MNTRYVPVTEQLLNDAGVSPTITIYKKSFAARWFRFWGRLFPKTGWYAKGVCVIPNPDYPDGPIAAMIRGLLKENAAREASRRTETAA